ncbi:HDOD domain-containing protein [Leptospira sp. GIMC2001]|uniref:HDOD domain-containing protein n=1 Tax=Leptospira sp. GIMC2001 TaxID=1513297 RepID=UPI00234BD4CE|nr:HDOD domain-containing protein [Leptospira sp. GIMC2001]WCL49938.1 HDOD domain-containing protein [Leptospira sp. GIMC2001]
MEASINSEEILAKLQNGDDVSVTYQFITDEVNQQVYAMLIHILANIDKLFLVEVVYTVIKEALMNAVKANAKREYFTRRKLDITNPVQYESGMRAFLTDIIMNWNDQEEYLKGSAYYVCIRMRLKNQELMMIIENNAPLLPEEQDRIQKRIDSAKKYNDLSDAFLDMGDNQESAGLGIILSQLLLKNSGIGQDRFKISSNGKETRVSLLVPDNTVPVEISNKLKTKILNEMEGLPPLPQSLTKIINLCSNPDSDLNMIANEIEKNPALSADILKLSNSAGFMSRQRVSTILQAVKVVGLKNIRNLLYVTGVRKVMDGQYGKVQEVWDHSNRTSYYARYIANESGKLKYGDIAAVGGLLHDLGKLLLLSIEKNLFNKLIAYQKGKEMNNSTLLEEISLGISHATLGSQLAKKWDFPEDLITIIDYHHKPFITPEPYKEVVEMVYLANMMSDVQESKRGYFTIDPGILNKFLGIKDKEKFDSFIERIEKGYQISIAEESAITK